MSENTAECIPSGLFGRDRSHRFREVTEDVVDFEALKALGIDLQQFMHGRYENIAELFGVRRYLCHVCTYLRNEDRAMMSENATDTTEAVKDFSWTTRHEGNLAQKEIVAILERIARLLTFLIWWFAFLSGLGAGELISRWMSR